MKLRPLGDRVIIELAQPEQTTEMGILIPESSQEKPQFGVIVAVGNGTPGVAMTVKNGEKVMFGKFSGTPITSEGKSYLIMREGDIFAVE